MSRRLAAIAVVAVLVGCRTAAPPPAREAPAAAPAAAAAPRPASIVVDASMGHPHVGDPAPDFTLTDQDGKEVRLSSMRGKVVVVAFVASWCPFSQAEQPHLARLAAEYGPRGVSVVAIDLDETEEGYRTYLARASMPLPVLHDERGTKAGINYLPPNASPKILRDRYKVLSAANLVIDREGRIAFYTLVDTLHFDAEYVHLRESVDSLLASAPAAP